MNVTATAADFGSYYAGSATIEFNALDIANGGNATLDTAAGAQAFNLDVTAGRFVQQGLYFALMAGSAVRLCEGSAYCPLGTTNTTPIVSPFVGPPKPGGALGNVQWDGAKGTISLAWTWLK